MNYLDDAAPKTNPDPKPLEHLAQRSFRGFELQRELGSGRSGIVWLATRTSDQKVVTLKHARSDVFSKDQLIQARTSLIAEIATLGRLKIPGLPMVLDLTDVEEDGVFGLVYEHVEGRSLNRVLQDVDLSTPGRIESLLVVFEKIAGILSNLHNRGISHGNITGGNILIGEGADTGKVFLLDLVWSRAGLARTLDKDRAPEIRTEVKGRPGSDQWSLAKLLAEAIRTRISGAAWSQLPGELRRALDRGQNRLLAERFPRIDQFAQALTAGRADMTSGGDPSVGTGNLSWEGTGTPSWETTTSPTSGPPKSPAPSSLSATPTLETHPGPEFSPSQLDISGVLDTNEDFADADKNPRVSPLDTTTQTQPRSRKLSFLMVGLLIGGLLLLPIAVVLMNASSQGSTRVKIAPIEASTGEILYEEEEEKPIALVRPPPLRSPQTVDTPPVEVVVEPAKDQKAEKNDTPRRPACTSRTPRRCRDLGERALRGHAYNRARILFERACDARDALSCVRLAAMWAQGQGGEARMRTAESFLRRACALGHAPSCEEERTMLDPSPSNQ